MIKFKDFQKLDIRVGTVIEAERVEGSEKLLRLVVDLGHEKRQLISGIAKWYSPEDIINKQFTMIINLEPRTIMGLGSQGMLLAVDPVNFDLADENTDTEIEVENLKPIFLVPDEKVPNGSKVV